MNQMLGTRVLMDFSERIWTTRSFASSPTWRLPSLTSDSAVASAASKGAANSNDETTRRLPVHGLNLFFILGRIVSGVLGATMKAGGVALLILILLLIFLLLIVIYPREFRDECESE